MSDSGKPWQQHLDVIKNAVGDCYEELHHIWSDCGYDDGICVQRRNAVASHIKMLLSNMLKEEAGHKNHLIAEVEEALKEITVLSKELRCNIPTAEYENYSLIKMEKALRNTVEHHRHMKEEKQRELAELKEKEKELCDSLGIDPLPITHQVPTDEELDNFRQYLTKREEEKLKLEQVFKKKQAEIMRLITDLEYSPSLQIEESIIHSDDSFIFSEANMNEVENFHRRLDKVLKERKALICEQQTKLTGLWDRLSQDIEYRNKFLSSLRGYGLKTVDRIKNEIARLEEIKRQNIKKYVEFTRGDLEEWWGKCHFSEEQKQCFVPYHSDCYTEDLLELHEMEVQKLKQFYEANINIFQLMKQRQDFWDKMLDIENRTHDKNRLFGNRGGQLLQEERERKQIQKDLPKIEAALQKYLKIYEKENGAPFLLNGEVLFEVIRKQWKEHQENKDQEKQARKKLRDQESAVESRYGARSVTKDSTSKRKRCDTPTCTPQSVKHPRLLSNKKTPSTSVVRSGKAVRPRDNSARARKAVRKSLRLSGHSVQSGARNSDGVLARELSIASTALSYTHFEGHLELLNTESKCRSSVKPENVRVTPAKPSRRALTPRNFDTPRIPTLQMKTPLKTPRAKMPQGRAPDTPRFTTPRIKLPVIF